MAYSTTVFHKEKKHNFCHSYYDIKQGIFCSAQSLLLCFHCVSDTSMGVQLAVTLL